MNDQHIDNKPRPSKPATPSPFGLDLDVTTPAGPDVNAMALSFTETVERFMRPDGKRPSPSDVADAMYALRAAIVRVTRAEGLGSAAATRRYRVYHHGKPYGHIEARDSADAIRTVALSHFEGDATWLTVKAARKNAGDRMRAA